MKLEKNLEEMKIALKKMIDNLTENDNVMRQNVESDEVIEGVFTNHTQIFIDWNLKTLLKNQEVLKKDDKSNDDVQGRGVR